MKRSIQDKDQMLVNLGVILLLISIFVANDGSEAGVVILGIGGLCLGVGLWLEATRFI